MCMIKAWNVSPSTAQSVLLHEYIINCTYIQHWKVIMSKDFQQLSLPFTSQSHIHLQKGGYIKNNKNFQRAIKLYKIKIYIYFLKTRERERRGGVLDYSNSFIFLKDCPNWSMCILHAWLNASLSAQFNTHSIRV